MKNGKSSLGQIDQGVWPKNGDKEFKIARHPLSKIETLNLIFQILFFTNITTTALGPAPGKDPFSNRSTRLSAIARFSCA